MIIKCFNFIIAWDLFVSYHGHKFTKTWRVSSFPAAICYYFYTTSWKQFIIRPSGVRSMATNYHKQYNVQIPALNACVNNFAKLQHSNWHKNTYQFQIKSITSLCTKHLNAAPKPPQHNLITVKASFLPRLFVGPYKAWVRRGYVKTS